MLDLAIRGATLVTAEGSQRADLGIAGGRVACIADSITDAARTIEAEGLWLLPGGVDSHCHIEEPNPDGSVNEESFESASRSAFAGGTTSVVCFVPQWKGPGEGRGILPRLEDQMRRARAAMLDVAFHQIITDPTDDVVEREIPEAVRRGIRSFKVFLTYDEMHVTDAQYIRVLEAAKKHGCLVTVHCENYDAIRDRTAALLAAGHTAPRFHAASRPPVVEREATHRAIALAEMVGTPIQVFHVSCAEAAEEIARAQARGAAIWGETCPQYVTLTAADMDRPGFEGAKYMCSPAPRDAAEHARIWAMIGRGVLDVVSSDHCAFSYEGPRGKRRNGADASFERIPNGIPGLAARLPLLFSEGVSAGRITPEQFVRLSSTNPAKLMGLWPRKGGLHIGADADAVLWDPRAERVLTNALMQHAIDYTPYEGRRVTGWPKLVLRRGEVVMQDDAALAQPGSGEYLPRGPFSLTRG
jgi:dihydropyrimidinase